MFHIQTLNKIAEKGLALFDENRFSLSEELSDPDGILLRSFKLHEQPLGDRLRAVARAGAGVNNIPVDRCTEQGVVVFNTPGANANSVKELVLTGLLISSRKVFEGVGWARTLSGQKDISTQIEKQKSRFAGPEIMGKTLGVVGLGAIGVMVANAASSLGMTVIGHDPFISVASAWGLSRDVRRAENLEQLLAESDYLTLHVPLNGNTEGMINASSLARVRDGARLLNFARGELVDNGAVIEAISAGRLSAYVTDFPTAEMLELDAVIPVPHLGASTPEAEENCAVMAAAQLIDFLENGNIKNSVNFPECVMTRSGSERITVANRNIPNMVGQITTILAQSGLNITDMLNRHRGEFAYNIIDVDGDVSEKALDRLRNIEGVVSVRHIA